MGVIALIIFLPILAIPIVWLKNYWYRGVITSIAAIQLLIFCLSHYTSVKSSIVDAEFVSWFDLILGNFGKLRVHWFVAVDGLSFLMSFLTLVTYLVVGLYPLTDLIKPRLYVTMLLLLNTALLGTFLAMDFFLFFVFYELMLIPMYFLIGMWGGEHRQYAAIKFFLFTLFGSIFLLVLFPALGIASVDLTLTAEELNLPIESVRVMLKQNNLPTDKMVHSLSIPNLSKPESYPKGAFIWDNSLRFWCFIIVCLAFAIKLPVIPIHTWLPDAHVQAPTPVSVLLAGVLLKTGGYGLIRFGVGFFPDMVLAHGFWIGCLGVGSILYGSLLALAQNDLKAMVAYSSIAHMGFVTLGIASGDEAGLNGAIIQLFSHGLISTMLFWAAGIIQVRFRDRTIDRFGGLWQKMPIFTFFMAFAVFAGSGLPGLSGFIAEVLVLAAAFRSPNLPYGLAFAAAFGILLSAGYFIWAFKRLFMGELKIHNQPINQIKLHDLSALEVARFVIPAVLILLIGIWPNSILSFTNPFIEGFIKQTFDKIPQWIN